MIKKIKKIKNLGIFSDYVWDSSLPDFKRYNIIYGWNGCGKTTLSSLFDTLESGQSTKFPELEYEIDSESGVTKQGTTYSRKVRVFNQDYVANNVQVLSCTAKPIYILGEENKKIADQIEKDEKEVISLNSQIKKHKLDLENQEKDKNKKFTDIARTISSNTSGEATRRYDKRDAEEAFKKLLKKELIDEAGLTKHNLTLRQLEKPQLTLLSTPQLVIGGNTYDTNKGIEKINEVAVNLCRETVETVIIDKLKDNADISEWVENGIHIHETHKSTVCEFCNQSLPKERLLELAKHFNDADKKLKIKIDENLSDLRSLYSQIETVKTIDKANLYDEIQPDYQKKAEKFETVKKTILGEITKAGTLVKEKKSKTTEVVNFEQKINLDEFLSAISEINELIKQHNDKSNNFKNEKLNAQKELEKHYLSTIFDDINELETKMENSKKDLTNKKSDLESTSKAIIENKSKISSSHKACKAINDGIKTFLGRDEITFEVEGDGYVIKRHGKIAENLSEGEKTAIAFVYFTVHLQDQNFDTKEGILVIDDPVSSLDSNSLFQAFAFLKNSVKDAKQIFVLTHNFDFLRLLLNWVKNIPNSAGEKSYYMIKNTDTTAGRVASISLLDKDLQDHESEYHFLFKLLYTFKSDGTIMSVYHMPNIARKALETFLMFRVPSNQSPFKKLESLNDKFDQNKLTAIYKFTNDQSHITGKGLDPSLVQETQKNVKYLLEMIQTTFPEHYSILEKSITG
ncbi:MAG: AAA family ATPase [bacterium]|nr:MAG: AAA family ATPase [bacterium]